MNCRACQVERAKQCATCEAPDETIVVMVANPDENWFWCCVCGAVVKWRLERCELCGRLRPDLRA